VVNEWRNRQVSARRFAIVGSSLAVLLSGTIGLTSTTLASAAPKVPVAKVVAQAKVLSKLMNKGFVWSFPMERGVARPRRQHLPRRASST
jgi:hypothetical protein